MWESFDGDFDCVAQLEGHENEVKAVGFSASGSLLATCGRDKSVFIWEVGEDENFEVAGVLHAHAADVKAVAWHPALDVLASCSYDDSIKLYAHSDDEWRCSATLTAHTSTVWALAFSPDGRGLASCSDDSNVVLWKDTSGECAVTPVATMRAVHERAIYSIDWATDASGNGVIATGGGDNAIALCSAKLDEPGQPVASGRLDAVCRRAEAHAGDVNSVAWRPAPPGAAHGSGRMLASCGDDGTVRLWRCE